MSTKSQAQKLLRIIFFVIFLGFLVNFFRQATIYFRTNRRLTQKEKELKALEEKNRALKVRLEEVQTPKFLEEQARKLLGVGESRTNATTLSASLSKTSETLPEEEETALPNYQKWWRLFVY